MHDAADTATVERLRRPTLVQAPLALAALAAATLTIASVLWGLHPANGRTGLWWATVVVGTTLTVAGLVAVRGCFLEFRGDEARDVVAWREVHRFNRRDVRTARVVAGVWRLYELEMEDGRRVRLLGISPHQWPARLLPEARQRDLADLEALMGEG